VITSQAPFAAQIGARRAFPADLMAADGEGGLVALEAQDGL